MIGTTNQNEFLADETGNRRWLPAQVTHNCDPKLIERDRDQLWAEGRDRFNADGVVYQIAEKLAAEEHCQYTIKDPWLDEISKWLDAPELLTDTKPLDKGYVRVAEVAAEALQLRSKEFARREELRIASCLRDCGLVRKKMRIDEDMKQKWVYTKMFPFCTPSIMGEGYEIPF